METRVGVSINDGEMGTLGTMGRGTACPSLVSRSADKPGQ